MLTIYSFISSRTVIYTVVYTRRMKSHVQGRVALTCKVTHEGYNVFPCVFKLRDPNNLEKNKNRCYSINRTREIKSHVLGHVTLSYKVTVTVTITVTSHSYSHKLQSSFMCI